jgi:membrane protein required for colicin V production
MNGLDLALALVILICVLFGSLQGISRIIFSIAAFCVGIAGGFFLCTPLSAYVYPFVRSFMEKILGTKGPLSAYLLPQAGLVAKVIAFVGAFIVLFILVKVIHGLFGLIFKGQIFRGLDRALGLLLGIAGGLALSGVILLVLRIQPFFKVTELLEKSFIHRFYDAFIFSAGIKLPEAIPLSQDAASNV